jgi:bifunctional DNA-binding transcriptional regulator/antitoxin component of YhaV-PrlF toxin-antitoxin module
VSVARISPRGWVAIPAEYRRTYGIRSGGQVHIVDYGGLLAIVPLLPDPVEQACGILRGPTCLTEALLAERRSEREHEDAG